MKIVVISTVFKKTPPDGYGGIERVVHLLVEELVRQGHDVTLFATPGSRCSGTIMEVPGYDPDQAPSGIRKKSDALSEEPLYEALQDYLGSHSIDVIHDWSFQNLFVLRHPERVPFVISTCIPPSPGYRRPNLVACSRAHAALCGQGSRHVYYGLDLDNWGFSLTKKDHFIHISKIAPYKGQHLAVLAARKGRRKLVLAGNIENRLYYYSMVKPLLWLSTGISHIGEISGTEGHLRDAAALIQTPRWFDAFPLVILESFASGTPVIAFPEGGIPEQIMPGVNGYLCSTVEELADAMENIGALQPKICREYAREHFSVQRMAKDYCALYEQVMQGEVW
jgi:glycosyltransferase involved in cell wall biosynthesis